MNDFDYVAKQLQREEELNRRAFKKFCNEMKQQEKIGDGANTPIARKFKNLFFTEIVAGLESEIDNPNKIRASAATKAIQDCLGYTLTYKKDKKSGERIVQVPTEKSNYFDLNLGVYQAITMALENAVAPAMKEVIIDKKTGQEKRIFPAVDRTALMNKIGNAIEKQIYYSYISACFPEMFRNLEQRCSGNKDGARSSSYYFHYNMTRALKAKQQELRDEGRNTEADAFDFKPFGASKKFIGDWLLNGVIKYSNLFEEHIVNIGHKQKKAYIILTTNAEKYKERYIQQQERIIIDDMPMLCPPVEATDERFGSWLLSTDIAKPHQIKGRLRTSALFLEYINHLQKVGYKINPFTLELMTYIDERNDKLGKFNPHNYQEPMDMAQVLGVIRTGDWKADGKKLEAKGDAFTQEKKRFSNEKNKQLKLVQDGRKAKVVLQAAKDLHKSGADFYYPHMWDFRSRAYSISTNCPEPQGTDYQKAALLFAIEQPIDSKTKFWLSVEIANNAGYDKVSFGKRVEWVEHNLDKVILVGSMFEKDNETNAINYLQSLSKEKPFLFAAACHEYYRIFIKKDKRTTSLRCGVDMSCSAAGIHAGWKRDAADAEAVNITPSTSPQDLYTRVWNRLLELNRSQPIPPLDVALLDAWTEHGYGRKIAKKMIMVFQYSAGIRKQMSEFYKIHDDLPEQLQMPQEQTQALWKLWPQVTASSMSVDSVINWFQARAKEIAAKGVNQILIPNATGVVQEMNYPLVETIVRTGGFHNGRHTEYVYSDKPDVPAWLRGITANATHMADSAIMTFSTLR